MRSRQTFDYVCTWCKHPVATFNAKTLPHYTDHPNLPVGTLVIVCGPRCKSRPEGAPVGSALATVEPVPSGRLFEVAA